MERKAQQEELDVLKSIFYNDEFQVVQNSETENIQVIFWAHLKLPEDFLLKCKESLETDEYSYVKISYLPPIKLHLILPESYPSECSPEFTISCQWMTKSMISRVCEQFDKLWCKNENTEIIYIWIDFLKNEVLEFLGITSELDLTELQSFYSKYLLYRGSKIRDKQISHEQEMLKNEFCVDSSGNSYLEMGDSELEMDKSKEQRITNLFNHKYSRQTIMDMSSFSYNTKSRFNDRIERAGLSLNFKISPLKILMNYNTEREQIEFEKKVFTCSICFTDQMGLDCVKFDICNHVFCKDCIHSYFTVQINDGNVHPIKCPENKCSTDATPIQVKALVSPEVYARYDSLLLQYALDSLEHVIYCPRRFCQYPATREGDESLAICPSCQYVFCIYCKKVYHGVEPCAINCEEKRKLIEKYTNASKEVREQMESRYGAKQLRTMVNNSMAETWIESNCKNCPQCNVSIEKSNGCNKMVCWKCNAFFCWLCSSVLDRSNPYSHYGDNSRCANKLFYMTPLDPDEDLDDYNSDDEQWRDWDWV